VAAVTTAAPAPAGSLHKTGTLLAVLLATVSTVMSSTMGNVVIPDVMGTFGIGHGQEKGSAFTLGAYFGSLDAGTRTNMIRYDTPAIGPVGAAERMREEEPLPPS